MNDIFKPFLDDSLLVYLDEILVYSRTWDDHLCHVKKVLQVLQKEKLYVKMSKCAFGKTSLVYLGHIVSGGQLKIDCSKINVIVKWLKITNVIDVHRFLDVVQYWRRFISNFSIIASPLHALTSVKQTFQW